MWLEYFANPVLKSPWGAVGWGVIYIAYGLVADLSMMLIKLLKNETKAIVLSAVIFSFLAILLTLIPLPWFYVPEPDVTLFSIGELLHLFPRPQLNNLG